MGEPSVDVAHGEYGILSVNVSPSPGSLDAPRPRPFTRMESAMSRRAFLAFAAASVLAAACASLNMKKECYGDGVCRVEKNGQVTYEGPPDKLAKYQDRDRKEQEKEAALDRAYAEAPRRAAGEPIRLLVVGPYAQSEALKPFLATYQQMLEGALGGDPKLELVPRKKAELLIDARARVDAEFARRLRDGGVEADVVLVWTLAEKKVTGFVQGGKGVGVAEVNNVQLNLSMSSVYAFEELQHAEVGKSTDSLAIAGIDNKGKTGAGELKGKRNVERDRGAAQSSAAWVKGTLASIVGPKLPAIAAVQEIRSKNAPAVPATVGDMMKSLFGGRK
jgi:hypothetical protein